jgi:hypothetical protein
MTVRALARCASGERNENPLVKESPVADLVFVGLTVVLFAALAVLVRAVERR